MLHVTWHKGDRVIVIEGRAVSLPCKVSVALPFQNHVVVLLNTYELTDDDPGTARNVVALNREGQELWRIEETNHLYVGNDGKKHSWPWADFGRREDGSGFWIFSPAGYEFGFDPMTGAVLKPGIYTK